MNKIQRFRQKLAEKGIEKTPFEAKRLLVLAKKLFKSVTYEEYLRCKNTTDDDIRKFSRELGMTYKEAAGVREITLYVGMLKFGENDVE